MCIESLVRTAILGAIGLYCVWFYNISDEINDITNKIIMKNGKKEI